MTARNHMRALPQGDALSRALLDGRLESGTPNDGGGRARQNLGDDAGPCIP
jgi:hypothetical protein